MAASGWVGSRASTGSAAPRRRLAWLMLLAVFLLSSLLGGGRVAGAFPAGQAGAEAEAMAALIAQARQGASLAGPSSGVLRQTAGRITLAASGVGLSDFYARVRFTNPTETNGAPWDYGFGFRDGGTEDQYRLILESTSTWYFGVRLELAGRGAPIPGYVAEPGGENVVDLVVADDVAYFAVNGQFAARLDVSAFDGAGEVWVATAFFDANTVEGARTPYADFEVWELGGEAAPAATGAPAATAVGTPTADPAADAAEFERLRDVARADVSLAGPANGELVQTGTEAAVLATGVEVRDFYARVRFVGPSGTGPAGWDYGLAFRAGSATEQLRVIVDSTGAWYLTVGTETAFAGGPAAALDLEAGGVNTLEVVAVGGVGYFAVNGEFVARLDLSRLDRAGDVWIGTAFFAESNAAGAVTRYRDFEVWPLPVDDAEGPGAGAEPTAEAADSAGAATAAATTPATADGGEVVVRLTEEGDSGVTALAVLTGTGTGTGAETEVALTVAGASGDELAVIHAGTCDELDPEPAFLLRDPGISGRSRTAVPVELAALSGSPHAVVLRESPAAFETVVACGEIGG